MKHSESISEITKALLKAQAKMENASKNATNPHFKNRYADLAEILATVKPVLTEVGIVMTQFPGYENGVTTVETLLSHTSGEWISGVAGAKVQKDDPQGVGSAVTYLRRYSLAAVCGIAQEDDDGNAASNGHSVQNEAARYVGASYHAERAGAEQTPPRRAAVPTGGGDLMDEELRFGKFKGKTWGWLLEHNPDYVAWAVDNMERLAPEAKQLLRAALALEAAPAGDVPLSEPDDNLPF